MICSNCGKEVAEGMKFCPECGRGIEISTFRAAEGEVVENLNVQGGTTEMTFESGADEMDRLRKYNIGHLGVLFSAVLAFISVFLRNPGAWGNSRIKDLLSSGGNGDAFTYIAILAACLLVTVVMAYSHKHILALIGSVGSACWIFSMLKRCRNSILNGRGFFLFLVAGILLVVSAVAILIISSKRKNMQQ